MLAKPYTVAVTTGVEGKELGKSPIFPSAPGGPCGPGGPCSPLVLSLLPIISPKEVLGSPSSTASYLFFSILKVVLITLACVFMLYLVSFMVTVSQRLILSLKAS